MPKRLFRFGGRLQKYNELDEFIEPAEIGDFEMDDEDTDEIFNKMIRYDADYEENLRNAGDKLDYVKIFILDLYNSVMYKEEDELRGGAMSPEQFFKLFKTKLSTATYLSPENQQLINKKVSKLNLDELNDFVNRQIKIYDDLGLSAYPDRLRLYYFLRKINKNTDEGYQQRVLFFNTLIGSGNISPGYNINPGEVGFVCESVFYDNFIKPYFSEDVAEDAKPNISKWMTDILFEKADIKFADYCIEVKSVQWMQGRSDCKYRKPNYFCGSDKVMSILNSGYTHKLIVWAEICRESEVLSVNRKSIPNYKQYILEPQLFKIHRDKGLITEASNFAGEMTMEFDKTILSVFTGLP